MAGRPFIKKLRSSSLTTVVSIALVLFILGLLALLVMDAKKITSEVKENITVQVILNGNAKEADIARLQKMLDASDFVKSTSFITKDSAAKQLQKDLGEDFVSFLGYNPLLSSINIHLKAPYANMDSLKWIEKKLTANSQVKEVIYQKAMVNMMNENLKKVSLIMVGFGGLLMLVALALINNTIRLRIYSKRFLIKTMQLVGATQSFIRRPFILNGIVHGIYAAIISLIMIVALVHWAEVEMPDLRELNDLKSYMILTGLVLFLGIAISWISTFFALRRYLRLNADELYYH
ncbi:MAG TPA: permease-like cell division protein FtsX [Bacteroidia bacterium]|nr:permease-like cell division protein FtsX [Bacteroidia bacterium]